MNEIRKKRLIVVLENASLETVKVGCARACGRTVVFAVADTRNNVDDRFLFFLDAIGLEVTSDGLRRISVSIAVTLSG
jgi:hypothetical protein